MTQTKTWRSVADIAKSTRSGRVKAIDNVNKSLKLIEENKSYRSIISQVAKRAKERAREIDKQAKKGGAAGRLAGVPFIVKDNLLVYGAETTAASNILKGFEAPYQATAVERLENEGAICVAKANLDAFGHGASTENSDFFVTRNPHDKSRVPGGSSGGSAAAAALSLAPFTLGTDTGGSIRQPASFCGAVGYKPTYGLVSRSGVVAMGSSLDCVGPMARSAEDIGLVLDIMAGKDSMDSTTIDRDNDTYVPAGGDRQFKAKVGIVKELMNDQVNLSTRRAIEQIVTHLKKAGVEVIEVSLPTSKLSLPAYYILSSAEVSSNLCRYDGQRYGYSYTGAKDIEESYTQSRDRGFGDEAKRRIMIGTYVLSSGFYEEYYQKAQTVRTKIIHETDNAFAKVDFLLAPTTPTPAFKIGEKTRNPISMYLSDLLTVTANLAGTPSISLPAGTIRGLPVGAQFTASQGRDKRLLELAKKYEEAVK